MIHILTCGLGDQQAKREREKAAAERLAQQSARPPEAPGGAPPAPAIPAARSGQIGGKSEGNANGNVLAIW